VQLTTVNLVIACVSTTCNASHRYGCSDVGSLRFRGIESLST